MPTTIQQLMSAHPKEILEELAEVRERERKVAHERELLERVLEILIEGGGPSADWLLDDARGILPIGPLRSQIGRVLRLGPPGKAWQPKEVHEKLVGHGNNKVSLDNVRVTMGRMADAGGLFQPTPGQAVYILPPANLHQVGDSLLTNMDDEIKLEGSTDKSPTEKGEQG